MKRDETDETAASKTLHIHKFIRFWYSRLCHIRARSGYQCPEPRYREISCGWIYSWSQTSSSAEDRWVLSLPTPTTLTTPRVSGLCVGVSSVEVLRRQVKVLLCERSLHLVLSVCAFRCFCFLVLRLSYFIRSAFSFVFLFFFLCFFFLFVRSFSFCFSSFIPYVLIFVVLSLYVLHLFKKNMAW